MTEQERWAWVPGHEGRYDVSDLGRVRTHVWAKEPRIMRPFRSTKGYYVVGIPGRRGVLGRVVLEAFVGPAPDGHQASHLNGDPSDNRLANLTWHSAVENQAMRRVHGTHLCGSAMPGAKLDESRVAVIKRSIRDGVSVRSLAKANGVSIATIRAIKDGSRWTHVE